MKTPLKVIISLMGLLAMVGGACFAQSDTRPNILLIVADDLGYVDITCFGGDIETPNIDALAANGIRFSRFHTAPLCSPTRAMLMSGNDNHIAGVGQQSLFTNHFGYEGRITDRVATVPEVLRDAGYHTYMAGKWHLGWGPESHPYHRGFEHVFTGEKGATYFYGDQCFEDPSGQILYTENGKPVKWKDGDYSTDLHTDKLISYIDRHKDDGKPFFAYAAYTSPHWPLQVDEKHWRKFEGRYDEGYDVRRKKNLNRLKKMGMIPQNAGLSALSQNHRPWDSLTPAEQKHQARKMEVYAGLVDNLDYNIGRLIQYLKAIGEYKNTVILFMSDNGPAAGDRFNMPAHRERLMKDFNDDYDRMGKPDSWIAYGLGWAESGASPFRSTKGDTTEGGTLANMIMTGPGIVSDNQINHSFTTLMDVAPTFYEIAQTRYPKTYNGKPVYSLRGSSLMPVASGQASTVHDQDYVYAQETGERALVRKGHWKLLNSIRPFSRDNFELYDLSTDLAEKHNLKDKQPDKYLELLAEWDRFAEEIRVQFPSPQQM